MASANSMNAIRSVLLHLDATDASLVRAEAAVRIAWEHSATLTILQATFVPQRDLRLVLAQRLVLPDPAERAVLGNAHWLQADPMFGIDVFCHHAMYADLLVLGHATPTAELPLRAPRGFLEAALHRTGRPALIMPAAGPATFGKRVLVGWNASPPAARALAAAMPWLGRAEHVHVVDGSEVIGDDDPVGAASEIAAFLRLHGLAPTVQRRPVPLADAGDALLARCASLGADLLVMGCQGRSRAAEFIWGGATRTVLAEATVPILMAP